MSSDRRLWELKLLYKARDAEKNKVGPQSQSLIVWALCSANSSTSWWCLPKASSTPAFLVPLRNLLPPPPALFHIMFTLWKCLHYIIYMEKKRFWGGNKSSSHISLMLSVPEFADHSFLKMSGTLPETSSWSLECTWVWNRADQKSQGLHAPRSNLQTMTDCSWCRNTYFSYLLPYDKPLQNQSLKMTVICFFSWFCGWAAKCLF